MNRYEYNAERMQREKWCAEGSGGFFAAIREKAPE